MTLNSKNKTQKSNLRKLIFKIAFSLVILFTLLGCNVTKNEIPQNAIIKAKYIVHDENQSPNLSKCSNEIKDFHKMDEYDCSFKMNKYEFDIEDKFIYNRNGTCVEFWNYLSEGPIVQTIKELKSESKFLKTIGVSNMKIKWGIDKKIIITEHDTLVIEKIFPNYKLIWIKQDTDERKNGRRKLIEYR